MREIHTLSNDSRSDECTSRNHAGSLLSCDTSDWGALQLLVLGYLELGISRTEARRVCVNMVTGVVVSIGLRGVLENVFGIEVEGPQRRSRPVTGRNIWASLPELNIMPFIKIRSNHLLAFGPYMLLITIFQWEEPLKTNQCFLGASLVLPVRSWKQESLIQNSSIFKFTDFHACRMHLLDPDIC